MRSNWYPNGLQIGVCGRLGAQYGPQRIPGEAPGPESILKWRLGHGFSELNVYDFTLSEDTLEMFRVFDEQ